ncbi:MAG: hypothetical protein IJ166_06860 [Prevotella sp.]|nr:hypothetical protein [Prevotella sp.]
MPLLCIAEAGRAGCIYEKGVYLGALFLTFWNFANFMLVKDKATVDAHVNMSLGQFHVV